MLFVIFFCSLRYFKAPQNKPDKIPSLHMTHRLLLPDIWFYILAAAALETSSRTSRNIFPKKRVLFLTLHLFFCAYLLFVTFFLYKPFLWWTSLLYWLPFCNSFHMFIVLCEKYGVNYSYWGHVILFTFLVNTKSMNGAL